MNIINAEVTVTSSSDARLRPPSADALKSAIANAVASCVQESNGDLHKSEYTVHPVVAVGGWVDPA